MSYTVEAAFQVSNKQLARIGLDNALERAVPLESRRVSDDEINEDPNFPVINVTTKNTYETWRPTSFNPKLVAFWSNPITVDYVAVARHNIFSSGIGSGSVWVTPTGESSTKVADFTFDNDDPIFVPFLPTEVERAEVRFGTGAHAIVAVIHLGKSVVMERPLRGSMDPLWLSRNTAVVNQESATGQLLGSIVTRRGVSVAPSWSNLSKSFYNGSLRSLAKDMPANPFFFAWQPDEHPDEVIYGSVNGDPSGSHISRSDRYNFDFSMTGI